MNPWDGDEAGYDDWLDDLMKNIPDSWDGEDGAESIVMAYLHELESRVLALGGSLEKWPDDRATSR